MTTWVHYDAETGALAQLGFAPSEQEAQLQTPPEGKLLAVLPDGLISNVLAEQPDFSRLKLAMRQSIDNGAVEALKGASTTIEGQDFRYRAKVLEAQSWSEGAELLAPQQFPYLLAETKVRAALSENVTFSQVRGEVLAKVEIEAHIEALRVTHKRLVDQATNLKDIIAAAQVDWNSSGEARA